MVLPHQRHALIRNNTEKHRHSDKRDNRAVWIYYEIEEKPKPKLSDVVVNTKVNASQSPTAKPSKAYTTCPSYLVYLGHTPEDYRGQKSGRPESALVEYELR